MRHPVLLTTNRGWFSTSVSSSAPSPQEGWHITNTSLCLRRSRQIWSSKTPLPSHGMITCCPWFWISSPAMTLMATIIPSSRPSHVWSPWLTRALPCTKSATQLDASISATWQTVPPQGLNKPMRTERRSPPLIQTSGILGDAGTMRS
jgi:hypothetical protein